MTSEQPQFDPSAYGEQPTAGDTNAPDVVNGGVSMDDYFAEEVDVAQAEEVLRRGLSPNATYVTDPSANGPMNVRVDKMEEKDDAGNVYGRRTLITLTGRGTARNVKIAVKKGEKTEVETREVTAGLIVKISPDQRNKRDFDTGETLEGDDSSTKLWAQAVSAFKQTFGESPKTKGAVIEFLRDGAVRYRMIQVGVPTKQRPEPSGEPKNIVIAISAVRAKK